MDCTSDGSCVAVNQHISYAQTPPSRLSVAFAVLFFVKCTSFSVSRQAATTTTTLVIVARRPMPTLRCECVVAGGGLLLLLLADVIAASAKPLVADSTATARCAHRLSVQQYSHVPTRLRRQHLLDFYCRKARRRRGMGSPSMIHGPTYPHSAGSRHCRIMTNATIY